MDYSFDRDYELYIGTPTIDPKVYTKSPKETTKENASQNYYTDIQQGKSVKITSLQFKAKIKRTSKGGNASKDMTTFEIYNLSEASRKYAEQEGALIILKAGYKGAGELPLLYAGQIKYVNTLRSAPDVITKIVAGDAYLPQKNSRISRFYPKTTSKAEIIKDLGLSLAGVGEGVFATSTLEKEYFNSGYSASGKTIEVLEKLCKSVAHEVVIENNRVYVRPKVLTKDSRDFNKLSARVLNIRSNQLKDGSGKMNDNVKDLTNEKTSKTGYRLKFFLDGRVRSASFVNVIDGPLQGIQKVTSVVHDLDFRGTSWDTEVETEFVV